MFGRQHQINVVCPYCGNKFKESIRRLEKNAAFRHVPCGVVLECDIDELDEFLRENANGALAEFRPRLQEPQRYG